MMAPFDQLDLTLLAVWFVAVFSLALQIYLFATWPSSNQGKHSGALPLEDRFAWPEAGWRNSASGKRASLKPQPPWEAPPESALDGILSTSSRPSLAAREAPRYKKRNAKTTMKQRIIRAGIYRKNGIQSFQTLRVMTTATMLCSGFLIIPLTSLPWIFAVYIGALAGLIGYLAPSFWLDHRLRVRQTRMRRALPDALDLITVCIQGGLSVPAALARVARELGTAHLMLATELSIVEREIQMGRSTGEAMFQFAQRFNLEELRSLSSVIGQTEKYGGSIAGALKTYADGLRIRRRQRAEEMAQKAAVKLLFPTLLCIFPGIFVVVLGPTAMRMYEVMAGSTWNG